MNTRSQQGLFKDVGNKPCRNTMIEDITNEEWYKKAKESDVIVLTVFLQNRSGSGRTYHVYWA